MPSLPPNPSRFAAVLTAAERLHYWHPASRSSGARPYDLFIYGVRAPATSTNLFDDAIGVAYVDARGAPVVEEWPATTDPGRAALDHPTREAGTATVVPGQYRGLWARGVHHPGTTGAYPCLVPVGPSPPVWRGSDRSRVYLDAEGIQLHRAAGPGRAPPARVDWYSAGCQVLRDDAALQRVLALVAEQEARGLGRTVTYTLFGPGDGP